ncbi:secreted RxLR effector protein 161-like [Cryptomeria japonica]|uniref:secreted RxLR effector protein 161-like n=1 Tax=Cryptomeria japonica TaxID=3369 RepID=UPI0027DA22CD|nr:secreted RxLR effector protein 161-like [Cryptomeria japonica]
MSDCKPTPTPFLSGVKLEDGQDTPLVDCTLYRQLVGSLLYLTHSRPDLSYAVGVVSKYMYEPHELHWKVAKRILHYVQGTPSYEIHYSTGCTLDLIGYTDSDWAGDSIDRKSTSRYVLSLGSGPICWSSKKQSSIALSSTKAEYRGVVNATIQVLWLQNFLIELGICFHQPIIIWCDNQSTLKVCRDPVQRQRTKHIEIHMPFIRDLIHDGIVDLQYCPMSQQIADIFTKTFTEQKFHFL